MNSVNDRIKHIRTVLNLSQREFSKQVFLSQSSLTDIETGIREVNDRILYIISTRFNLSFEWLKYGNGDIFNEGKTDIRSEHLINIYEQLDKTLQDYLIEQSESLLKIQNENTITKK